MDGRLQALGHEPSSHANDGREADIQSLDDLPISAAGSAWPFITQKQDPCMDQLSCRGLARGHHPIQCLTLLDGQGHFVFLHRGTPSQSPKSSHRLKESRSHVTCQSKMDGTLEFTTRPELSQSRARIWPQQHVPKRLKNSATRNSTARSQNRRLAICMA